MIDSETFKSLEFDKILSVVSSYANSSVSRDAVLKVRPLRERAAIERRLRQIGEIRALSRRGTPLGISDFQDISGTLDKAVPGGSILFPDELSDLLLVLRMVSALTEQIKGSEDLPYLQDIAGRMSGFPDLLEVLERSLDGKGGIVDTASSELSRIRTKRRNLDAGIHKKLEEIIRDKKVAPFLQDDFITKRGERWVIPVRMDSKGRVQGVAHDVSNSGETVFLEPLEIIGLVNDLENTLAEEKAEERRILRSICNEIREVVEDIEKQFMALVNLDVLNSIARFADLLNLQEIGVNDRKVIELKMAAHPLLMLLKKEEALGDNIVPLDISMGEDCSVMLITGPNAGGKTITIKTVGLILLMALSGMPVPADNSSTVPVIKALYTDIGDEQSIEDSLSTFSAHISKISDIINRAGPDSIVLVDELGTGTDPSQGVAIGCAVLKDLEEKGATVFATTHLFDIVTFVYGMPGMVNASMEFDKETLTPLYRLRTGEPGQSHAFETARRYGLPARVLEFARGIMGEGGVKFHNLLRDLHEKRDRYEILLNEVEEDRRRLEAGKRSLQDLKGEMERKEAEVLQRAYEEAVDIVLSVRRQVVGIVEEARKEKDRRAVSRLDRLQLVIDEKVKVCKGERSIPIDQIREGEEVFVTSLGYDAEVLKVDRRRDRLSVRSRGIVLEVPAAAAVPRRGMSPKADHTHRKKKEEIRPVVREINLLGLKADEAVSRLEPFLNHASMAGVEEVKIIHGVGRGILKRTVSGYLVVHPLVMGFKKGEQHEGGEGVTVVSL